MLKQQPTLVPTQSNQYKVQAPVNNNKYHFIQSAREHIAEHYGLHLFEFTAEHLEFIDSLLADNKYRFLVAEHVEEFVYSPKPTHSNFKAS
jgi:hypothetical protein